MHVDRFFRKWLFLLCSVLLLTLASGTSCATETRLLLVVGDSLSAGYGLPNGKGWVDLLRMRLEQLRAQQTLRVDYTVVNASISGETTSGGLSRLPQLLRLHQPAIVLIELGANDGLRGLSLDMAQANLAHMIETSQQAHARVVLIGTPLPENYGKPYIESFSAIFTRLSHTYHINLAPSLFSRLSVDADNFQADRLHPNVQAQPMLLEAVWPALQPLLQ
ncbi:MAG: arylesterase [Burkholderiaceae bacterium]|nr:MAG: arylesterase [Burkholderiaceae bacterium]